MSSNINTSLRFQTAACCLSLVAAGVSPAVEPGILPGGVNLPHMLKAGTNLDDHPGGGTPPSTAGETPAATAPLNLSVPTNSFLADPTTANPAQRKPYVADDKYKLRAGDRVSFQILEDREPPKSFLVGDSGELDVPYLGRISAADRTCKQLASEIQQLLEKEYYYNATVILGLDSANKFLGRIYVWGQVRSQGPIDIALNENLTAGKAILRAGGFAEFASKKKVKLIRSLPQDSNSKQVTELNMIAILEEGAVERDVTLRPDDLIIVPSRLINF